MPRKAFEIYPKPSAPLTVSKVAELYGISDPALKDIRSFVARYIAIAKERGLIDITAHKRSPVAVRYGKVAAKTDAKSSSLTYWRPVSKASKQRRPKIRKLKLRTRSHHRMAKRKSARKRTSRKK